jgi:ketosteroid isomerase-like protein
MRRILGMAALVAIAAWPCTAIAQSAKSKTADRKSQGENVAETVAILDHVWLDAAYNRDTGTMAWLFTDGFVEIHPGGEVVNAQQQIDQVRDPNGGLQEIHPDDIQVRYASPDVAVLTDTTTIRGQHGANKYDGKYRVIRVFVKQDGRWRAAGAGITRITSP